MVNLKFKKTKLFAILLSATILFVACRMFADPDDTGEDSNSNETRITSLSLGKTTLSMKVGTMDYIAVAVKPSDKQKNANLKWSYDKSIIKCDTNSAFGVTITALKEGQTSLRCSCDGYDATCIITVSGFAENYEETVEPYIYSNTTIIQTAPGVTEKVYVSLYGGSAVDIDGYTWTCDNNSVCEIQPTGQYCLITAKDSGYSRIKITHNKAAYPYYMGVYVFADATSVSYITTDNNIVTMNQNDTSKTIEVALVNGKSTSLNSQFSWEIVNETADCPIKIEYNENKAVVTPVKGGSCTVRVTHPDAAYPLDILCRVLTIVKNVYINPSSTVVNLHGEETQTVTCKLENIKSGEYDIDAYEYTLEDYNVAEIVSIVGNQVTLKGKANGSCKMSISHEKAAYAREVLVIVDGQLTDAVDASCYITTSQNYIRTKEGAEGIYLNISLKGGEDGDEADFSWTIKSTAADGSSEKVINMDTANGTVVHTPARMAAQTYVYGKAYIEPLVEGTAVITITHPKVVYPTEVLVKVLDKNAILEEPLYFTGSGILKILNGESSQYTVELLGKNKSIGDENNIRWECDDSRIRISPSANIANVSAPSLGTGCTISNMIISHNKADADKKVLVMTADDQETLDNMKALYSDKLYYNISVGDTAYCMTSAVGFNGVEDQDGDYTPYDFSAAKWTVKDSSIASVEKSEVPLTGIVKGLRAGVTTVKVTVEDYSCEYTVTVYPEGAVQTEPEVYLTTAKNVITLSGKGKNASAYVTAINMSTSEYSNISWTSSDENVATVIGNGTSATVTAWEEGECVISVVHPQSQNTLKIYVRVGSEYVMKPAEPVVYISSQDVITMLRDDSPQRLDAVLVNCKDADTNGFLFEIDDRNVATISSQSANGVAYVKPVGSGQAEITITHPKTSIEKKVLVVVGNSTEELAGITYLTTNSNVVAVGEGNTKTVSVSVKNSDSPVLDGYVWTSSNPSVVDVNDTGATAVFRGNSIGTAVVTVTNRACKYPLQIIAQCVDPKAAAANPYIQLTSSVVTVNVGSNYTNVTADLIGGNESDYSKFNWMSNDSGICAVYGQNEVGKLKALKAGTTYITVSHPKAEYSAQLLVVCDEVKESECYISVASSIINMKPTDMMQSITANLINGSATDKYNFKWSLDVYDVVDVVYSANVCTITPKQQGQCVVTISHPKAAYPQEIVVTVQEYSDFAFPNPNTTLTQGDVKFFAMQIPNTKMATHVEYSVDNSAICSISGTKNTAQITGLSDGTTTVHAKLVATSTGVVQASSEMLVYIKKADVDAIYITSASTIYTVKKGKSQTLSAVLSGTGVTNDDQYKFKWTTSDTDIIQIAGISSDGSIKGQSIYVTALKPGEALVTCSHEKAQSDLQFYVVVPGTAAKVVKLNKSFMTIVKGSSGSTLKATIENSESSNDYYDIEWTVHNVGTDEVCRIMGSGQTVTVYPVNPGEADIIAQLPDSQQVAKCTVKVEAGKSFVFESTAARVQPFHSRKYKYIVSPPDATLTWTLVQAGDYFSYRDLGCDEKGVGYVEIEGIEEGSGNIVCITDGGAKGQMSVKTSWDYEFSLSGKTEVGISPEETVEFEFKVSPVDGEIKVESTDEDFYNYEILNNGDGTGVITITPIKETPNKINIAVTAVNPSNKEVIGKKNIGAKFYYKELTATVEFVSKDGRFSSYNDGILTLGDGELVQLRIRVDQKKADYAVKSITVTNARNGVKVTGWVPKQVLDDEFVLANIFGGTDYSPTGYIVTRGYRPTWDGNVITNWRDISWEHETYHHGATHCDDYYGMKAPGITDRTIHDKCKDSVEHMKYNMLDVSHFLAGYVDEDWETLYYNSRMGKYDDASLRRWWSDSEFESVQFWVQPACTVSVGNESHKGRRVLNENVSYYRGATPDTTVTYRDANSGTLDIILQHSGKEQKPIRIPIIYEQRCCTK